MTILTATTSKPTEDSKLGIAFTRAGVYSPLIIKDVKEGSIFTDTALRPGMIVDTVLGETMTWKTPKDAADALRGAPAGDVTVTVQVAMAEITKPSKDAKLGIALKNSTTKAGIFVSKIVEDGLFADSELEPGMKVLYINDVECPNNTKQAITLVKDAESKLTIIAIPTDLTPPETPAAPVESTPAPAATDVVEEKKEEERLPEEPETAATSTEKSAPAVDDEEDHDDPQSNKGIIDKIFATCIC